MVGLVTSKVEFFFSSRRRHTRWPRDWSSDVCSSDLRDHGAEVVHLASPFVLGAWGAQAARALSLPAVAVYQTDVPGYLRAYRMAATEEMAWRWVRRIHTRAARTLAPSTSTAAELVGRGVPDVWLWRRGVDTG